MAAPPPPSPSHLLRSHSTPLSALAFSDDNKRIYSGDSSGLVIVTSTRSLRAIASWKAHTNGLLGIEEWEDNIITHGRDNKLHVWTRIQEPLASASIRFGGSASLPGLQIPTLNYSMDINALNYCRFSLLRNLASAQSSEALIAVPNLVESSLADIWTLPSCQRLHAAIGTDRVPLTPADILSSDGRGSTRTGLIMSLHLFSVSAASLQPSSSDSPASQIQLLTGYENGSVALWRFTRTDRQTSVEGIGWEAIWNVKLHVESVMAMSVSRDATLALTVSADHLIGRYDLMGAAQLNTSPEKVCLAYRTKNPGNSAIAIRDDGRICAVGGWDGKIRLYSTKTLKPLGTLDYHKGGCQTVVFARSSLPTVPPGVEGSAGNEESDDDEDEADEIKMRTRWLVGGGKDNRVSIWTLISFDNSSS